ncbi:MAG: ApaG protein [Maribacter sp.]|jgi:ApaG protein
MQILITNGVRISVEVFYQTEFSKPVENKVFFAYRITIENLNPFSVQLLRRYWRIEDSDGLKREVEGEGVVGLQPILNQDEIHKYISGCPLRTGIGKMGGHFTFIRTGDDSEFSVRVPDFVMVAPFKDN